MKNEQNIPKGKTLTAVENLNAAIRLCCKEIHEAIVKLLTKKVKL